METSVFETGSRVYVTGYGPFRGLRGTIRQTHIIDLPKGEEPFCFYYVELEAVKIKEAVWFQSHEVDLLSPSTSMASSITRLS